MINKDITHENKYQLTESSTNEEFEKILKRYPRVNCIICNSQTAKCFSRRLFGHGQITINNKLETGVFLINNFR